jgi:hypothetical protein
MFGGALGNIFPVIEESDKGRPLRARSVAGYNAEV